MESIYFCNYDLGLLDSLNVGIVEELSESKSLGRLCGLPGEGRKNWEINGEWRSCAGRWRGAEIG